MTTETDTDTTDTSADTSTDDTVDTSVDTQADDTSTDTQDADTSADDTEGTVLGNGGDTEGKADDDADDSSDDTPAGAPEAYELSLTDADGNAVELDAELVAEADPILRELNLTNDQANQLVALAPKMLAKGQQSAIEQITEAGAQQRKGWLEAFKADPEIGGANQKESESLAAIGLEAMGYAKGHEFRTLLDETGIGNHPEMIRTFRQLGQLAGEDKDFARSDAASEKKPSGWASRYKTEK